VCDDGCCDRRAVADDAGVCHDVCIFDSVRV
jgi:hypothetical protein